MTPGAESRDKNGLWSRRTFFKGAAMAGCGLVTTNAEVFGANQFEDRGHDDAKAETRFPLQIPIETPPAIPLLTCAPAMVNMGDGKLRRVLAYNGRFPGPTWVARSGDWVTVRLQNGLSQPTITHWHGLTPDYWNDGGPRIAIAPGELYDYNFPVAQRAGLNFYHPHPHMLTGEQVCLGLAGAFIVRDAEEDALNLPAGAYEVPLVIRDASFDNQGNLVQPHIVGIQRKVSSGERHPEADAERGQRHVSLSSAQWGKRARVSAGAQHRRAIYRDRQRWRPAAGPSLAFATRPGHGRACRPAR